MKIVFATTQAPSGSTMIGRVLPLARYFRQQGCTVTVLALRPAGHPTQPIPSPFIPVGTEPFRRTPHGKERLRGTPLVANMLATTLRTARQLAKQRPDIVIVAKTLPHNVLGAYLYKKFLRGSALVIVDVDDFELVANTICSLKERAAIHAAERAAVQIASRIVAATPFLADHFEQLARRRNIPVTMIPTGIEALPLLLPTPYPLPPTILYIGSLSISSGHRVDMLPDILTLVRRQVPDARLVIAGSGDNELTLRHEFSRRDLEAAVTWKSGFTPPELPALLASSHVLVDPIDSSLVARAKSSSRTLLAAAAGYPIVTSNIGIRPYFLPDALHDRFFAAPADTAMYAEIIVSLIRTPLTESERASLRQRASVYTWSILGHHYLEIIQRV